MTGARHCTLAKNAMPGTASTRAATKYINTEHSKLSLRRQSELLNIKMRQGGIQVIYQGPNTSRRNQAHTVHPCLLKDLKIERANQAWMVDITYLRLEARVCIFGGFD